MAQSESFFQQSRTAIKNLSVGMRQTFRHMTKGHSTKNPTSIESDDYFTDRDKAVTIQYPAEQIPVPDVGRYRLHMEADDCIVCDKCARICPVDCITIESFKATEDLGYTSDGSKKRLELPVFDIDMAKCCYCGLCTTVCPTECLTMTKVFDYSEYDREQFVYHFGILSPEEEAQKRAQLEAEKQAKAAAKSTTPKASVPKKKLPLLKKKPSQDS
ncbi:NADH-quinone oxidoreductase subunit I [Pontibacter sp. G13]|uniref:NuoI/complex I 23 kDa subunit family protein n=1 Tax=Pontibacter sp. G13 TaxID=3074898 RepID=UPI00288BF124|nr:NADH-quinone oxidoreductase subunit I [Pontibacter sp. G13]WNJ21213.1 NADH-quinone oxidoreductase subunit I [Pontibacter sp. G13]